MSTTRTTDAGVQVVAKGRNDRRYSKDAIEVRLMPDSETGQRIMVRRRVHLDGDTYGYDVYDLFLTDEEAETVADALDDILDYVERTA
jgi:hypothetical protein